MCISGKRNKGKNRTKGREESRRCRRRYVDQHQNQHQYQKSTKYTDTQKYNNRYARRLNQNHHQGSLLGEHEARILIGTSALRVMIRVPLTAKAGSKPFSDVDHHLRRIRGPVMQNE